MLTNYLHGGAILLSLIATVSFLISSPTPQASAPDIFVNTTFDVADFGGAQQVGDLPGPDGRVSLREAIIAANNTAGPQVIAFHVPTTDGGFNGSVFTLKPLAPGLPALFDNGTTIDGASQTLFTGDTNPSGPEVVLDGSLAGPSFGINIANSSNNTIRGLVIHSFKQTGVQLIIFTNNPGPGPDNNKILGNYIGTDETGTVAKGNGWQGIAVNGDNNIIGGMDPGDKNLIAGNHIFEIQIGGPPVDIPNNTLIQGNFIGTDRTGTVALGGIVSNGGIFVPGATNSRIKGNVVSGNRSGIFLVGPETKGNVVQGNFIGTNAAGTAALANRQYGIFIGNKASNNLIGGTTTGDRNLISGNQNIPFGAGVYVHGAGTSGNQVVGNLIGTDITGTTAIPNGEEGVEIPESSNTLIQGNTIAFNTQQGITVGRVTGNATISRNSIFSNGDLGIDLGAGGVNPNDPGDADTGPNNLMNFPVLISAHAAPGQLVVKGAIDTPNPRTVTIEFFANPVPTPGGDPSGHGEGAVFLGSVSPNPQGMFTAPLPPVSVGTLITATATDADGNTSEFAANIAANFP